MTEMTYVNRLSQLKLAFVSLRNSFASCAPLPTPARRAATSAPATGWAFEARRPTPLRRPPGGGLGIRGRQDLVRFRLESTRKNSVEERRKMASGPAAAGLRPWRSRFASAWPRTSQRPTTRRGSQPGVFRGGARGGPLPLHAVAELLFHPWGQGHALLHLPAPRHRLITWSPLRSFG